jgi:subfamily B ATP-binding cassette protein MsbA
MRRIFEILQALNDIRTVAKVRWSRLLGLFAVCLGVVVAEALSLGLLYPALAYLEKGPEKYLNTMPAQIRVVIDALARMGLTIGLGSLLAMTLLPIVARLAFQLGRDALTIFTIHQSTARMRVLVFDQVIKAKLEFHRENPSARIHMAMLNQIGSSARLIPELSMLLASGVQIVLLFGLLISVSPVTALLSTLLFALLGLAYRFFYRAGGKIAKENLDTYVRFKFKTTEALQNARLIKIYGTEDATTKVFTEDLNLAFRGDFRINFYNSVVEATTAFLFAACSLAIFYAGAVYYALSLSGLGLFMVVLMRLQPTVTAVGRSAFSVATGLEAWKLTDILIEEAKAAQESYGAPRHFTKLTDSLTFKNVDFSYKGGGREFPALVNVDVSIPLGQIVGLVGKSGAGKSTLIDLIPRFLEPSRGSLLFDGVPAQEFDLQSLRKGIGFVPQEPMMFDDTIRANLIYGIDSPLSDDEVLAALKAAHGLDIINNVRGGLDAKVGDRGVRLSGGQRQRLALARAILTKNTILILDEPTNALDVESELGIRDTLCLLGGKVTIIIIAHRLETVQIADRILVLRDGRIVDDGAHETLQRSNPYYRKLFNITNVEADRVSSP